MIINSKVFPSIQADPNYTGPDNDDAQHVILEFNSVYISQQATSEYCSQNDSFYLQILNDGSIRKFLLSSFISKDIISKIVRGDLLLIIDNCMEVSEYLVDVIYEELVIKQGIPAKQIVLVTGSSDITSRVFEISAKLKQDRIKLECFNISEKVIQGNISLLAAELKQYRRTKPTKVYTTFNRRWRPHRIAMLGLLYGRNLLQYGNVSFGKTSSIDSNPIGDWDGQYDKLIEEFKDTVIHEQLIAGKNAGSLLPLQLDLSEPPSNRFTLDRQAIGFYTKSIISLVNETCYDSEYRIRFLTEKVFKPVSCMTPFIIASTPYYLELFRECGYKTFSPFIDESYDSEPDDAKRLNLIVNEVERICKMTPIEQDQLLINLEPIVRHNFEVLTQRRNFIQRLI